MECARYGDKEVWITHVDISNDVAQNGRLNVPKSTLHWLHEVGMGMSATHQREHPNYFCSFVSLTTLM